MIEELRYTPQPKNRRAHALAIILVLLGVATFVLAGALSRYGALLQIAAIIAAVSGIFVAMKYIFLVNTYVLMTAEDGTAFFLVEQMQGQRKSTVCQLPAARILGIRELTDKKEGDAMRGRCFSYVATLGGKTFQIITARGDDGGTVYIKIEADAGFVAAFRARFAMQEG